MKAGAVTVDDVLPRLSGVRRTRRELSRVGATVLPVYTLRLAPRWFEIIISPPLGIPKDVSGNPDYAAAVQAYADRLAPFVLRDPGQWRGWRYTRTRSDEP